MPNVSIFVTSAPEVRVPCFDDVISLLLDSFLYLKRLVSRESVDRGNFHGRIQPELHLAVFPTNVYVRPAFLAGEKEKTVFLPSENRGTHKRIILCAVAFINQPSLAMPCFQPACTPSRPDRPSTRPPARRLDGFSARHAPASITATMMKPALKRTDRGMRVSIAHFMPGAS